MYATQKESSAAITRITDHIFKGAKLSAIFSTEQSQKSYRLIIRNLSFSTVEKDISDVFSPFGPISEIHLPRKSDSSICGFAFIQFVNKDSAVRALTQLNAINIRGRKIAIDYSIPKHTYQKYKSEENTGNANDDIDQEEISGNSDVESTNLLLDNTEVIGEEDNQDTAETDNEDTTKEDNETSIEEEDNMMKTLTSVVDENYANLTVNHSKKVINSTINYDPNSMSNDYDHETFGKTLFIRNLLFETDYDKIYEKFSKFGKIQYIKIVRDHLGRSKGCAFVSFKEKEDTDACLEKFKCSFKPPSFIEESKGSTKPKNSKILLNLYDNINSDWMLDGRNIDILQAIPKMTAKEISDKSIDEKKLNDKRNLYLLKESSIDMDSPDGKDMSLMDKQKRIKATQESSVKLKNLNCFISKTRISIRNMPLTLDEKELRSIIFQYLNKAYPEFKSSRNIKQVKIMKSDERKTAAGKARSLGYAFVEFSDHKYALSLIRKLNNKKDIFTPDKRPIVEFAIENGSILAKRQERAKSMHLSSSSSKSTLQVQKKPFKFDRYSKVDNRGAHFKKPKK